MRHKGLDLVAYFQFPNPVVASIVLICCKTCFCGKKIYVDLVLTVPLLVRPCIILSSFIELLGMKVDVFRFLILTGILKEMDEVFHSPLL